MQTQCQNLIARPYFQLIAAHETSDKLLPGGIVLLIHGAEQKSQQFLASGHLIYCSYIGREVSIGCRITLGLPSLAHTRAGKYCVDPLNLMYGIEIAS